VTGDTRTFTLGHAVQPVAAGGGLLLAGIAKAPEDIVAELPGTVLRAAAYETFVQNDPAIESFGRGEARRQVDAATCARLLDYPAEGSTDRPGLRPVVAAAMPEVSADGRTYTFQIRPGFAFSPPSNEPLTADTYRYSIERAMSPALGDDEIAPGYQYLSEIRGALALRNGQSERLEGLRVEGDRLIIDLVRPSATFLERLWLPLFCPVPIGTPVVNGGINDPPIPSAGKYFIAGHYNDQLTILTRNPNYPEASEGGFDSIALFHEPNLGRAIGRVERGELDYIAGWGPELAAGGRVDQAWGPGSGPAGGGDQRLFRRPTNSIDFLAVNSASVALADRDVRRAVALALDRTVMTPFGMPTDEVLPLTMPGLIERDRFPLDGPGTEEARALMGDRRLSLTMAWWHSSGCPECPVMARDMVRRLAAIGIDLSVTETEEPWLAARGPQSGYDLAAGWGLQPYPDPAAFLYDLFEKATPDEWIPKADRDEVAAALELGGAEGDAAAGALAERVADNVEVIPLDNGAYGQFVSERVGCLAFQQFQAYLDLAAACLG
jgi:peptide/nickel transport system substrate-binding protein